MSFKSNLCVLTLSVILAAGFLVISVSTEAVKGNGNIFNMTFLGSADGKSFYAEDTPRNWTEAVKFCNDSGMRLANVTSIAQLAFLVNAYNSVTFDRAHWVDGEYSADLSRLSVKDERFEQTFVQIIALTEPEYCWAFDSFPDHQSYFHAFYCESTLKTLCENNLLKK